MMIRSLLSLSCRQLDSYTRDSDNMSMPWCNVSSDRSFYDEIRSKQRTSEHVESLAENENNSSQYRLRYTYICTHIYME